MTFYPIVPPLTGSYLRNTDLPTHSEVCIQICLLHLCGIQLNREGTVANTVNRQPGKEDHSSKADSHMYPSNKHYSLKSKQEIHKTVSNTN